MSAHSSPAMKPLEPDEASNAPTTTEASGSRSRAGSNTLLTPSKELELDELTQGFAAFNTASNDTEDTNSKDKQSVGDKTHSVQDPERLLVIAREGIAPSEKWSTVPEENLPAYISVGTHRVQPSDGIDPHIIYQGYTTETGKECTITICEDGITVRRFPDGTYEQSNVPEEYTGLGAEYHKDPEHEFRPLVVDKVAEWASTQGIKELWRIPRDIYGELPAGAIIMDEEETD